MIGVTVQSVRRGGGGQVRGHHHLWAWPSLHCEQLASENGRLALRPAVSMLDSAAAAPRTGRRAAAAPLHARNAYR